MIVLIAENAAHVKAVAAMTERDLDPMIGRSIMADGAATTLAGAFGGVGTTTYAENIGVMGLTRVYSTLAYIIAGGFAIALALLPKFGAIISAIPIGVLGNFTGDAMVVELEGWTGAEEALIGSPGLALGPWEGKAFLRPAA